MAEHPASDDDHPRLEGRYTNCLNSGFNAFEFVLDFGQCFPGAGEPQWHTRVITSPAYAKALFETMWESLAQYESTHGPIPPIDESD
jgi:hypothetical protein